MKKIQFLLVAVLFILYGCESKQPTTQNPEASFTYSANGLTVKFTNTSKYATSYTWNFGDDNKSTETNPTHTYSAEGNFTVILEATSSNGIISSKEETITISSLKPAASFTYQVTNRTVEFTNTSKAAAFYKWDFGDEQISTEKNPKHTYAKDGSFKVTLTSSNSFGKSDTYTTTIEISTPRPTVDFSYNILQPLTIELENNSINATSYIWDFGDGESSEEKEPTHRFATKGVYEVTLIAKNLFGKTNSKSINITIENPSKIYFAGINFGKVPYNNQYYYVTITDDDVFTTTWVTTKHVLLNNNSNIPYTYTFATPVELSGLSDDDYYMMNLYYSTTNTGSGTKVASFKMTKTQILTYPEKLTGTNDTVELTTYFSYE